MEFLRRNDLHFHFLGICEPDFFHDLKGLTEKSPLARLQKKTNITGGTHIKRIKRFHFCFKQANQIK